MIHVSVFALVFKAALKNTTDWVPSTTEIYFCTVLEPGNPKSRC